MEVSLCHSSTHFMTRTHHALACCIDATVSPVTLVAPLPTLSHSLLSTHPLTELFNSLLITLYYALTSIFQIYDIVIIILHIILYDI